MKVFIFSVKREGRLLLGGRGGGLIRVIVWDLGL